MLVPGTGQHIVKDSEHGAGICSLHDDASGHEDCFTDAMREDEDGIHGRSFARVEVDDFVAERLTREDIESTERFVHRENSWFDGEGTSQPDVLPHTARRLLEIHFLEAPQNRPQRSQGGRAAHAHPEYAAGSRAQPQCSVAVKS